MNNLIQFLCNESSDANGLKKTSEFLRVVFSSSAKELKNKVDQCCKVQLKNNMDYGNPATLNFWCFSPALGYVLLLVTHTLENYQKNVHF